MLVVVCEVKFTLIKLLLVYRQVFFIDEMYASLIHNA